MHSDKEFRQEQNDSEGSAKPRGRGAVDLQMEFCQEQNILKGSTKPLRAVDLGYDKLIQYALRILSKKRYTENEMRSKLDKKSEKFQDLSENAADLYMEFRQEQNDSEGSAKPRGRGAVDLVMDRLHCLKYLNDTQYAIDYVSDRVNFKPRGKYLIKRELLLKGINADLVEKVISESDIDEVEMAGRVLEKIAKKLEKVELKKRRQRAFSSLASKGFSTDTIYKTVENWYLKGA